MRSCMGIGVHRWVFPNQARRRSDWEPDSQISCRGAAQKPGHEGPGSFGIHEFLGVYAVRHVYVHTHAHLHLCAQNA